MEHVVAGHDVVHEYAGGLQPAVHLGLVHAECAGYAADAEGGEIYLVGVHIACRLMNTGCKGTYFFQINCNRAENVTKINDNRAR